MSDLTKSRAGKRLFLGAFLIALAIAIIAWLIWKRGWEKRVAAELAELRSAGYPASGVEMNTWTPVVPTREDGAFRMRDALNRFEQLRNGSQEIRISRLLETNGWTEATRDLARRYIETNQPAFAKLDEALPFKRFKYVTDFSQGPNTLLPHLAPLRTASISLMVKAALAADQGRESESIGALEKILRLADSLKDEPFVVSWNVRTHLVKDACTALEWVLNHATLSDDSCLRLDKPLAAAVATNSLPMAIASERAISLELFGLETKNLDQLQSMIGSGSSSAQGEQMVAATMLGFAKFTGLFARDADLYLRAMKQNIALATQPPPASFALADAANATAATLREGLHPVARLLFVDFGKTAFRDAEFRSFVAMARTALAIERYRRANNNALPEALEHLVPQYTDGMPIDPFDAQPIRYRREPAGYLLWSIGPDRADNNGAENKKKPDTLDLTFKVSR